MELRVITPTECSLDLHQKMVNRMEVSFHKYGPVMDAKGKIDEIASLKKRLENYERDGNTEWLVDVANFAMIEFMHRGAENFRATDSDASPGLTYVSGRVSSGRHTPAESEDFYRGRQE